MSKIIELPSHVADLIAAGEVVERPASVIKELVENAIDSGATAVSVEIQGGGMSYMRVTDNGCGMSAGDAETAFLRHATSKLRAEQDLEAIRTLGFRGEALAAISAVSRVDLLTRETGANEGTSLSLEAGTVVLREPAGCPDGTTIIVRNLFFNTPARLKFVKRDSAETAGVTASMVRAALSHPEVSFRYIHDSVEEFHTPGDSRADSCIYSLLGRDFWQSLTPVLGSGDGLEISGYVCTPAAARGNRSHQFFFLNGRWIKSAALQAALEQAYRNSLFTGRFPACVLYLTAPFNSVDVNVHPSKTEVKFINERNVFDAVYHAVLSALNAEQKPAEAVLPKAPKKPEPESPHQESIFEKPPISVAYGQKPLSAAVLPLHDIRPVTALPESADSRESSSVPEHSTAEPSAPEKAIHAPVSAADSEVSARSSASSPSGPDAPRMPAYRILGEAWHSYIAVETDESLLFIDKHAAHERMLFDTLKARVQSPEQQLLMAPVTAELDAQDFELIMENLELFTALGFDIDAFGSRAIVLRALPCDMDIGDAAATLMELAEDLRRGGRPGNLSREDEILATVACKAAVKAGWNTDILEAVPCVEKVLSGEIKYCPHGRPVVIRMARSSIEKTFKRT